MKTIYLDINREITARKTKKIAKKLYKISKKEEIVVALSKNLEKNTELYNNINEYGIKILNGKWLLKFLLCEVIEYISVIQGKKQETQTVAVLIESQDDIILGELMQIAKNVKTLKIISNSKFKFNYLEEKLYEDFGIAVQITNNKRKALLNSDIIINYDYNEEKLEEYSINSNAILVNIEKEIKNFSGTSINDYLIEYDTENFIEADNISDFNTNIMYESYIYRKDTLQNIQSQLKKDNVRLIGLIESNGKYYLEKILDKPKIMA